MKLSVRLIRLLPALHREVGDAVKAEGRRISRLDWVLVVVLHGIDNYMIDCLRPVEGDLHPVREANVSGIVPVAAIAGVETSTLIIIDRRYRISRAVGA